MVSKSEAEVLRNVNEYYGSTIQSRADLCTTACLVDQTQQGDRLVRAAVARVHQHVQERFYGCGSPIPPALKGLVVLDLGCGSGRDCYALSQLVGPEGRVIGVDMNEEQLAVARQYADWHAQEFGYANVDFRQGQMEQLATLGITDESIDLVVSNCVLNLALDKGQVLREVFRVLKPGGELYFSDIFSDRRIPRALMQDPVLHGECLAGAWYRQDLSRLLASCGCVDLRISSSSPISIDNPDVREKVGFANFTSRTVRAFKLPTLEDSCEDYGQVVMYRGTIAGHPHAFHLDDCHEFPQGKRVPVCGNTADMLSATRFKSHFELSGDKSVHYGLFYSGNPAPLSTTTSMATSATNGSCC